MYLLDTNIVSELRRPNPHPSVVDWIRGVSVEHLYLSAVTVGEIQSGIELVRERDARKAEELETWLNQVLATYNILAVDAAVFREWAKLMHRRSGYPAAGRHDCRCSHRASADGGDPERP